MTFRFLHAADIHLDSPLRGLSAYPGAPVEAMRSATRDAFREMIDFAIRERVSFVVIAGDLYDGDWRDFNTGIFFAAQMGRLGREGIRVMLLRGNHDAESQITKSLTLPENVSQFGSRKPETVRLDEVRVALHGQSFPVREVKENLAAAYPPPVPGYLNIGVLHTALQGAAEHAPYAPCTLDELLARGYDYWALGHVHERAVLHESPWVVFSGNLQGRHARETGPKGAVVVTCQDGEVIAADPVDFDIARWLHLRVDVAGAASLPEVLDRVRDALGDALNTQGGGRLLAVRVSLEGATPLHGRLLREEARVRSEIQAIGAELGGNSLWIEKALLATETESGARRAGVGDEAASDLHQMLADAPDDEELRAQIREAMAPLLNRLPSEMELETDDGPLGMLKRQQDADLIRETAPRLVARLLALGETKDANPKP